MDTMETGSVVDTPPQKVDRCKRKSVGQDQPTEQTTPERVQKARRLRCKSAAQGVLRDSVHEGLADEGLPPTVRAAKGPPPNWLPEGWKHGVKTTCRSYLPAFVSPGGKLYYHKKDVEQAVGRQLAGDSTVEGATAWAVKQLGAGKDWRGQDVVTRGDGDMLARLTDGERAALPGPGELHFAVVSARRATAPGGIKDIVNVQAALVAAGARPRWYVDEASVQAYQALGLDAVVGGRLTPARNKALQDAADRGCACVQVSDDISKWVYAFGERLSKLDSQVTLQAANAAASSTPQAAVSPVSAARFILAKMRHAGAKLGGVFPLSNLALALLQDEFTDQHFILGDFFVADVSPVRFDTSITLKEDYDYTCSHLREHGKVVRCNRLILHVRHCTNAGGAVAIRDSKGEAEQRNIAILRAKWPGVFRNNASRPNEVIMAWSGHRPATAAAADTVAAPEGEPKGRARCGEFPGDAIVVATGAANTQRGYIKRRLKTLEGRTVRQCLTDVYYHCNRKKKRYSLNDLRYDVQFGRVKVVAAPRPGT